MASGNFPELRLTPRGRCVSADSPGRNPGGIGGGSGLIGRILGTAWDPRGILCRNWPGTLMRVDWFVSRWRTQRLAAEAASAAAASAAAAEASAAEEFPASDCRAFRRRIQDSRRRTRSSCAPPHRRLATNWPSRYASRHSDPEGSRSILRDRLRVGSVRFPSGLIDLDQSSTASFIT